MGDLNSYLTVSKHLLMALEFNRGSIAKYLGQMKEDFLQRNWQFTVRYKFEELLSTSQSRNFVALLICISFWEFQCGISHKIYMACVLRKHEVRNWGNRENIITSRNLKCDNQHSDFTNLKESAIVKSKQEQKTETFLGVRKGAQERNGHNIIDLLAYNWYYIRSTGLWPCLLKIMSHSSKEDIY